MYRQKFEFKILDKVSYIILVIFSFQTERLFVNNSFIVI